MDFFQSLSYIGSVRSTTITLEDGAMKVSEILKVKGNILFTVTPDSPMLDAVNAMAEKDIGSLVVMEACLLYTSPSPRDS